MLQAACSECGTTFNVPRHYLGRTLKCPKCSTPLAVPPDLGTVVGKLPECQKCGEVGSVIEPTPFASLGAPPSPTAPIVSFEAKSKRRPRPFFLAALVALAALAAAGLAFLPRGEEPVPVVQVPDKHQAKLEAERLRLVEAAKKLEQARLRVERERLAQEKERRRKEQLAEEHEAREKRRVELAKEKKRRSEAAQEAITNFLLKQADGDKEELADWRVGSVLLAGLYNAHVEGKLNADWLVKTRLDFARRYWRYADAIVGVGPDWVPGKDVNEDSPTVKDGWAATCEVSARAKTKESVRTALVLASDKDFDKGNAYEARTPRDRFGRARTEEGRTVAQAIRTIRAIHGAFVDDTMNDAWVIKSVGSFNETWGEDRHKMWREAHRFATKVMPHWMGAYTVKELEKHDYYSVEETWWEFRKAVRRLVRTGKLQQGIDEVYPRDVTR